MKKRAHVIVFLGPPGCGKGTQASRLSQVLKIPAISTGEMLRNESQSGSELGLAVSSILASGQLVSDDVMNQVVANRLRQSDCTRGCILDGYPRTQMQARFLDSALRSLGHPKLLVFDFFVSNEEVIQRLRRRRQCAACGRIFSIDCHGQEAVCDRDGSPLVQRSDDYPDTIRRRFEVYEQNAWPLVDFYRKKNYSRIYAGRAPEEITAELLSRFDRTPVRTTRSAALIAATA